MDMEGQKGLDREKRGRLICTINRQDSVDSGKRMACLQIMLH